MYSYIVFNWFTKQGWNPSRLFVMVEAKLFFATRIFNVRKFLDTYKLLWKAKVINKYFFLLFVTQQIS